MSRQSIRSLIVALAILPGLGFRQQPRSLADAAYKAGVLAKVADLVESRYVLADKAKGFADAFRAKGASGAYAPLVDPKAFAGAVTADLVSITGDKHLNFRVIVPSAAGEQAVSTLHHPVRYSILRADENAGYFKLNWIEPRIGLLELRRFNIFGEAKELARAAMTFLAGARAIIVDVRENRGGSGDYLSSYFLPYPTQLCGNFTRSDGVLTEAWTRGDIGMAPRTDVPVFILIGPDTFSAAESFAYDMQSRQRAVLIGEPTGGGAHDTDLFVVDEQFEIYISTGRAVSPVTGGNWEGVGGPARHPCPGREGPGRGRGRGEEGGRGLRPGPGRKAEAGRRGDAAPGGRGGQALPGGPTGAGRRGPKRLGRDRPGVRVPQRVLPADLRL